MKRSKLCPVLSDTNTKVAKLMFLSLVCLLPGEIVVNEVNFVRKCISAENSPDDLYGKLICTNFKVSFIPQDAPAKQVTGDFKAVTTR